ncbi:MAG TPA: M20 family metallopeptidase [Gammaproteobacteria bacterium]
MRRIVCLLVLLAPIFPDAALAAELLSDEQLESVMEFRRWAHENPELGNHEFEAAERIATHLREMDLEVKTGIAVTGVVGVLDTGKPGPVVAVRADMDALPVTEKSGLPFASTKTTEFAGQQVGVAHACGHDIHMSVGLGTAQALVNMKDELRGTVMFIFQPAEEGVPPGEKGGAEFMLEEGVFEELKPDAIFALHSFPDLEVGEIGYSVGPAFAATDHFVLTVNGEQTHGAYPHLGKDPIVIAAEIVGALQTIDSRTINPRDPVVVTVGMIHGGERFNIIPGSVEMEGTVRTYDKTVQDKTVERIKAIANGITQAHGGSYELIYNRNTPAVINDPALSEWAGETLRSELADVEVQQMEPTMGGEDFAYFSNVVPGFYFRLGTLNPEEGSGGLHTPTFRADGSSIPVGIKAMTALVTEYLENPPKL